MSSVMNASMRTTWRDLLSLGGVGLDDSDVRTVGGTLGAVFVAVGSIVVAATVWLLPSSVNRPLTWWLCAVGMVGAALIALTPWHRFPVPALLAVGVGGHLFLGLSWSLIDGTGRHYFGLVLLAYCHAGLTQRRAVSLVLVPCSVLAALAGHSWSINAAILIFIGIVVAESLASLTARQRRTHQAVSALLRAVQHLSATSTVEDAARVLSEEASAMLGCDFALVYTADQARHHVFVNRAMNASLGPLEVDIDNEASGVGVAVRSAKVLAVGDTAHATMVSQRLVAATQAKAVWFVPLIADTEPPGVLVVGWHHSNPRLDRDIDKILDVLAAEAGRIVRRLIQADALTTQALTDPLTAIGNRRVWEHGLDTLEPGDAVVLLDIDGFKLVNDNHGHDRGDVVLREFAGCLRTAARDSDLVARIGGDEFAVILRKVGTTGVAAFADRLRTLWDVAIDDVTYSTGHATHHDGQPVRTTVNDADQHLYKAKALRNNARHRPLRRP